MDEKMIKSLNRLIGIHTYTKTNGEKVHFVPSRKLEAFAGFKMQAKEYLESKGCQVIDTFTYETAVEYNHEDLMDEVDGYNIVISKKRKNIIIGKIEALARNYHYNSDYQQDDVIIPHHKLLYFNLMPWELEFAYRYIDERGYLLRGIDLTISGEEDNFLRSSMNKGRVSAVLTRPFAKRRNKDKIKELVDLKHELDSLRETTLEVNDYRLQVKFNALENKYHELREELLNHNSRLVEAYILNYELFGQFVKEKKAIAYELYVKAFDKYINGYYTGGESGTPYREYALSTFIFYYLKKHVYRDFYMYKEMVRKPINMINTYIKVNGIRRDLSETMSEVTSQDIADEMGLTKRRVEDILGYFEPIESYDVANEELMDELYNGGFYYEDGLLRDLADVEDEFIRLYDPSTELFLGEAYSEDNPENAARYGEFSEVLMSIMADLSEREKKVLLLRYGLEDDTPMTLEEVAREFGVGRERIRQTEAKTLSKLRRPSKYSKLKDYMEQ